MIMVFLSSGSDQLVAGGAFLSGRSWIVRWSKVWPALPRPHHCRPESKRPQTDIRGLRFWSLSPRSGGGLADRHLQCADAVDAALDLVARRDRGNAGRRAGHDDVAGADLDLLRQFPDDLRDIPDQLGEVTLLPFGAVHGQPDPALRGVTDLRSRLQR